MLTGKRIQLVRQVGAGYCHLKQKKSIPNSVENMQIPGTVWILHGRLCLQSLLQPQTLRPAAWHHCKNVCEPATTKSLVLEMLIVLCKWGIITYPLLRSPLSRSRQSNCSWVTSGYFLHKVPNSRLTWRREDKWIGFSNIQSGISVKNSSFL